MELSLGRAVIRLEGKAGVLGRQEKKSISRRCRWLTAPNAAERISK